MKSLGVIAVALGLLAYAIAYGTGCYDTTIKTPPCSPTSTDSWCPPPITDDAKQPATDAGEDRP